MPAEPPVEEESQQEQRQQHSFGGVRVSAAVRGHRRTPAVVTSSTVAVPTQTSRVINGGEVGFFEAFINADEEGQGSGMLLMAGSTQNSGSATSAVRRVVDDEPCLAEEEAGNTVSSVDSPRNTEVAAPAASVEEAPRSPRDGMGLKTDHSGGFDVVRSVADGAEMEESMTAADNKAVLSDDEPDLQPERPEQRHRTQSPVASPDTQLASESGPVGIRALTTAGGQVTFGLEGATTTVAPGELGKRPSSSGEGEVEEPPSPSSSSSQDVVFRPSTVPRLDPARLVNISLSEKRRIKKQQAEAAKQLASAVQQQDESCSSQPPRTNPTVPPSLTLPAVSGSSDGPTGFEDIPPVPPLRSDRRSPSSVVPAGGNTGERFAGSPGFPPQVQLGAAVNADVEYEGDVEESDPDEDSDGFGRESTVVQQQQHFGGGHRPRLYAPSLSTIRDSSPAPPSVVRVAAASSSSFAVSGDSTASSSLVGTADDLLARSYALDNDGVAECHASEESPARYRGSDDTPLVDSGETSDVQGNRRRWAMGSRMLSDDHRSELARVPSPPARPVSSPTPSSTDSDRTARPACSGEEQNNDTNDPLDYDVAQMNRHSISLA